MKIILELTEMLFKTNSGIFNDARKVGISSYQMPKLYTSESCENIQMKSNDNQPNLTKFFHNKNIANSVLQFSPCFTLF